MPRALAYARRASEQADTCGDRRALFHSANQHGVFALRSSNFDEAAQRFRSALQLAPELGVDEISVSVSRDNLGYCLMCTGAIAEGVALCGDAAAALETIGARQFLPEVYQDLCYGALQEGRFQEARLWGEKALDLARQFNHPTVERNTLMLLADAAMDLNDEDSTEGYLQALSAHYPDFRGMKSFLRAFNVREVINLKA
jgi:Tfp pilus assembly protein PilF